MFEKADEGVDKHEGGGGSAQRNSRTLSFV